MFTKEEKQQMISHSNVYRSECERKIRRIRRNKKMLSERFDSMSDQYILDNGVVSPDDEIEYLKKCKARSVIIKRKIILI